MFIALGKATQLDFGVLPLVRRAGPQWEYGTGLMRRVPPWLPNLCCARIGSITLRTALLDAIRTVARCDDVRC